MDALQREDLLRPRIVETSRDLHVPEIHLKEYKSVNTNETVNSSSKRETALLATFFEIQLIN